MPAIAFRIKSDRIQDTVVPEGTTVRAFTELLSRKGYDVAEADIRIRRKKERDTLIGDVLSYKLKNADAVEYATEIIDTPVADRCMQERACAEVAAKAQKKCGGTCRCGHATQQPDVSHIMALWSCYRRSSKGM